MTQRLLLLSLILPLATASYARRGEKIVECVDKKGKSRFAGGKCKKGERMVAPEAIPDKPPEKKLAPPGILSDREGVAVKPRTGKWVVHNVVGQFKWDKKENKWIQKGRIKKRERDAVENAIEVFNMTRDLDTTLIYKESEDTTYDLNKIWKNRNRFVVYWAKDSKRGSLPKPYRVRNGANAGGCSIIVQNPDGSYAYGVDGRIEPGAKIAGAAMFMVEFSRRVRKSFKCPKAGHRYEFLHQLGHCLGLGHKTPNPSVMGGTCGEDYYPNDILNIQTLYGIR
ncbi:MAG: hypothetical protein COB53_04885 [Elusimicrobia bacterium]|nr:MAG: hypothetical protein COB53_04885 [Elusimicrobiota bacterium]